MISKDSDEINISKMLYRIKFIKAKSLFCHGMKHINNSYEILLMRTD